jgi:hypothetical protein
MANPIIQSALIATAFLLAGFAKGVSGLGLPTVGMGLLGRNGSRATLAPYDASRDVSAMAFFGTDAPRRAFGDHGLLVSAASRRLSGPGTNLGFAVPIKIHPCP